MQFLGSSNSWTHEPCPNISVHSRHGNSKEYLLTRLTARHASSRAFRERVQLPHTGQVCPCNCIHVGRPNLPLRIKFSPPLRT